MKVYVRNRSDNIWHWELECPQYPENGEIERVYRKPAKGEFCSICKQIEAEGKNKRSSKEILGDDNIV